MARSLVIVESPAKAKTINKYLGRNYSVKASYGHVMDLPKKSLGIDLDKDFEPTYEVIPGKTKTIAELKTAAKDAEAIFLAADPDREGEAICAHLAEVLGRTKQIRARIFRVMFNEITQKAIKAAFEKPHAVDTHLVDAQQARRVLDRLVGYKISPLLWDKVRRGLSAGRVQTVALRLIVEREAEIRAFQKKEYWTIHALLDAAQPPQFEARFFKYQGEDLEIPSEPDAARVVAACESAKWRVASVTQKEKRRNPTPPFTTSKLQQAAYNRLRFTAKRTMALAQRLYEGIELGDEGAVALITYMRTDSVRVSADAVAQVRDFIGASYGSSYLPDKPNFYKSKKDAQEAHEAVRPTDVTRAPEDVRRYLDDDSFKLYQMIWQRFVASQMVPAVFDQTTIDAAAGDYTFRATGSVVKFDGYLKAYHVEREELDQADADDEAGSVLPRVAEGDALRLEKIRPEQHFTEPPPRYTEATLVKELEEKGIGRPSTYASIISTIVEREYVSKDQGRFTPTMLGERVALLLIKSFEDIFDVTFTARMEEELDEIEEGKLPWRQSVREFWDRFSADLEKAGGEMASYKAGIPTDQKCEKCGMGTLLERISRHGFFLGCSRYPECDFIRDLSPEMASEEVESESGPEYCENCGREMTIKRGRFGQFLACTGYPDCKTTKQVGDKEKKPDVPLEEKCPKCANNLVLKHGRFGEFTACSNYPKCKYVKQKTIGVSCPRPNCDGELAERRSRRGKTFFGCVNYPDCDFTAWNRPVPTKCPECGNPYLEEKNLKSGTVLQCPNPECKHKEKQAVLVAS